MLLKDARIVLTGASGGLGEALARQLLQAGASLLLTARDPARLERLAASLDGPCSVLAADLSTPDGVDRLAAAAHSFGANVLINNAGIGGFGLLDEQRWDEVERILATNLAAPIRLTQALLPALRAQPAAIVVNIGSAFGSIPFAGFAAYSAAKAGLHAFSQGLRRELADTAVRVVHVSPRAIDTTLNSAAVKRLNAELGNTSDAPQAVARVVLAAIEDEWAERVVGQPERLFAWLNACAPALVDRGLRGKLSTIKRHAGNRKVGDQHLQS